MNSCHQGKNTLNIIVTTKLQPIQKLSPTTSPPKHSIPIIKSSSTRIQNNVDKKSFSKILCRQELIFENQEKEITELKNRKAEQRQS